MIEARTDDGLAGLNLPEVVPRETWLRERIDLLEREKAHTRERDALNAARRRLPMVEVTADYRFEGSAVPFRTLIYFFGGSESVDESVIERQSDPMRIEPCS